MTIDKRRLPGKPGQLPDFLPVPRHYNRHDGWTPERQQRFIEALADTGSVKAAAHAVNMTPEGAYLLRRHKEAASFRKAWEAALALGVQQLEDVAMHRALHGQDVPVYSYGKLIGKRTVYNDRLLMFLLKNRAPTRFAADGRVTARRNTIGDPQDAARLSRLKRQWRKEWEEEAAKLAEQERETSDEAIRGINRKLEKVRRRMEASMSDRTRELWDAYQQSVEEDRKNPDNAWHHEVPDEEVEDVDYGEDWGKPKALRAPDTLREPGEPRELPRFLTHGDAELGLPRGRLT